MRPPVSDQGFDLTAESARGHERIDEPAKVFYICSKSAARMRRCNGSSIYPVVG